MAVLDEFSAGRVEITGVGRVAPVATPRRCCDQVALRRAIEPNERAWQAAGPRDRGEERPPVVSGTKSYGSRHSFVSEGGEVLNERVRLFRIWIPGGDDTTCDPEFGHSLPLPVVDAPSGLTNPGWDALQSSCG